MLGSGRRGERWDLSRCLDPGPGLSYGSGSVWFDDLIATIVDGAPKEPPASSEGGIREDRDIALVPSVKHTVGGDANERYFLVGPAGKAGRRDNLYKVSRLHEGVIADSAQSE
jgi:hypothetical protein